MSKLKRGVAIALAATMVFGSSMVSFAAGETSGESQGTGTSEGHVDKKVTNVVLPTVSASDPSPFNYTMDPESLIAGTASAKYENAEFPSTGDTGVYFNNGKKGGDGTDKDNIVYKNSSLEQKVVNKSSHSVDLTVKAEAVNAATDIPLVAKDAVASADAASLYLGLIVNTEAAVAVTKDAAATKTVSIAGTEDNFKVAVKADKTGYEYRELTLAEYQALDGNTAKTQDDYDATWKAATFKLEGSTTPQKTITSATTAPAIKVTWSWVDPASGPSLSNATANTTDEGVDFNVTFTKGTALTCAFTGLGDGVTLKSVTWGTSVADMTSTTSNIPLTGASFTVNSNMWGSASSGDVKYVKLTASDNTVFVIKLTIA